MGRFIRIAFILLLLVWISPILGAQTWNWVTKLGNGGNEIIAGIEKDGAGNYFIAGIFAQNLEVADVTLESIGFTDVFLAKLNDTGQPLWAVSGGSTNIDQTAAISADLSGNVIWAGQFWVQGFFGEDTLFAQSASRAIFLAKYDNSGEYLWSLSISGSAVKVVNDVATDANDNIYLTGYFEDSLFVADTVLVASSAEQHFFIIKFDAAGNMAWSAQFGLSGLVRGSSIAVDNAGDIIAGGYFQGVVDFGGYLLQSGNIDFDLFVVKFSADGTVLWARETVGVFDDFCSAVAVDPQNNIYVSGSFLGEMSLGENIQINTPGFKVNLFLLKYGADGQPLWARALDSQEFNDSSLGTDIDVLDQQVAMTGYFEGVLKVDEFTVTAQSDQFNGFAASFKTSDGKANWLRVAGGSAQLICNQILAGNDGKFIVGGYFSGKAFFDNETLTSNGSNDIFIAEMKEISTTIQPEIATAPEVEVYPNPAGEVLNISIGQDVFFIKIYNMQGSLLMEKTNERQVDISSLPPGSYMLWVENGTFAKSILFIKS